jgi:PAS domain S-box-containing protein
LEENESLDETIAHFKKIIETGSDTFETRHRTKYGEIKDMLISAVPIRIRGRNFIQNIRIDITEHKKTEEALKRSGLNLEEKVRERTVELVKVNSELKQKIKELELARIALKSSEDKFRSFMRNATDFMYITDKNGKFIYTNKSMSKTLGYSEEELLSMELRQVVSNDAIKKTFNNEHDELMKSGKLQLESIWVGKNGNEIYGEVIVDAIYDNNGEFIGASAVLRDITQRKLAEDALMSREVELKAKTKSLEEMNTALRVLLKKRDEDRLEIEEKVLINIKELVEPYLAKLKINGLNENQSSLLSIIESNLNNIVSPFITKLSSRHINLSPAELKIASLIKLGKSSKEIAEILSLSRKTIDSHRYSIRKKLDIRNNKSNLRTHLSSFM